MKPYPAYKESGIAWLGEIPEHWTVSPIKYLVGTNQETLTDKTEPDYQIEYVDIGNVTQEGLVSPPQVMKYADAPSRARRVVRGGDTIVSTVRTYLKAIAFFSEAKENLIASTGFAVLTPTEKIYPKFLHYLVSSQQIIETITAHSVGVSYPAINSSDLVAIPICYPSGEEEQQAIADYLDRKTAVIDSLIAKKERQIALMQEQKTAVINHAVTKDLNPHAPLKDSGIPWFGNIPSHWEIKSLKQTIRKFVDYRGRTPTKTETGIPLITAKNIKEGVIDFDLSSEYINPNEYDDWMVRGLPELGDVLITTEAPLGETAQVVDTNIALAQRIILLKSFPEIMLNTFLKYYFLSQPGHCELQSRATGSTALGIKGSKLRDIAIIVPPVPEQKAIVQYLEKQMPKARHLTTKLEKTIELLREYRTAVISAAVTGKIDVREAS